MKNSEWLTQLAKEAPDELAEWFDAEHVDVDRDYVSRETHSKAYEIWQAASGEWCKRALNAEAERDDALEIRDKACGDAATFKAERDEWKTKCETREVAYKQADAERKRYSEQIDELFAERDEWKAKAESALHENPYAGLVRGKQWERTEISDYYCGRCGWKVTDHDSYCPECGGALHGGSSKVRVGSSSAKRAAAVERIKHRAAYENWLAVILGIDERSSEWMNISADEVGQRLIDLLSDDDELPVPSSSPNGTSNGTANGTCPDGDETCPNDAHSKAQSTNAPKLSELYGILSDEADSRERLEADLETHLYEFGGYCFSSREGHADNVDTFFDDFVFLLDRQAAITRREVLCYPDERDEQIAELTHKLDDAEFERDELRDRLEDDWKYANLKKQVDLLTVRAVGAEQEADELTAIVDRLTAEREKLREKVKNQTAQLAEVQDALKKRNQGELKKRWQKQVDELQGKLDYCRKRYEERIDNVIRERGYWREQVRLCLDSAYPPSHSPERSYDPNVMAYPDRHGCTTPSSLVSAVIDGLRDKLTDIARTSLALMAELPREDEDA